MELRGMIPMLACANVAKSMDFYASALGFTVQDKLTEKGKVFWACIQSGKVVLMLTSDKASPAASSARKVLEASHPEVPRGGLVFYYYPDDVAVLHAQLKERRLKPGALRVTNYGMKEFTLRDPDGYEIWFGQQSTEPPTELPEGETTAKAEKKPVKTDAKGKPKAGKSGRRKVSAQKSSMSKRASAVNR